MTDYANGFKDGFAAGLEEGKKLANLKTESEWTKDWYSGNRFDLPTPTYLGSATSCSVCGKDFGNKIWGYVCANVNCPTRVTAYSGGAVGSVTTGYIHSVGANGPAGPIGTMNDPYELGN